MQHVKCGMEILTSSLAMQILVSHHISPSLGTKYDLIGCLEHITPAKLEQPSVEALSVDPCQHVNRRSDVSEHCCECIQPVYEAPVSPFQQIRLCMGCVFS